MLESTAADKKHVSSEIENIKSNVALVKSGLGAEIDRLAVSCIHIIITVFCNMKIIQNNIKIQENINGTHTYAASCQEYFDLGNRANGKFKIRPNTELHAFEVECEFNESGGLTVMKPKQWNEEGFTFPPSEDQRCSETNCFTHDFEYSASDYQIEVNQFLRGVPISYRLVFLSF